VRQDLLKEAAKNTDPRFILKQALSHNLEVDGKE